MTENLKTSQTTLSKTVRLEETTVQDINRLAKEENRNFNNSVETLLKWAIANRKVTVDIVNNCNSNNNMSMAL